MALTGTKGLLSSLLSHEGQHGNGGEISHRHDAMHIDTSFLGFVPKAIVHQKDLAGFFPDVAGSAKHEIHQLHFDNRSEPIGMLSGGHGTRSRVHSAFGDDKK